MVLPFVPWRKPSALVEGRCARLAVITALVLCLPPLPPITPPRPNITCLCSARYTHVASISRIGGCCKLASCHPPSPPRPSQTLPHPPPTPFSPIHRTHPVRRQPWPLLLLTRRICSPSSSASARVRSERCSRGKHDGLLGGGADRAGRRAGMPECPRRVAAIPPPPILDPTGCSGSFIVGVGFHPIRPSHFPAAPTPLLSLSLFPRPPSPVPRPSSRGVLVHSQLPTYPMVTYPMVIHAAFCIGHTAPATGWPTWASPQGAEGKVVFNLYPVLSAVLALLPNQSFPPPLLGLTTRPRM